MVDLNEWSHKDEWRKSGDRFLVVVSRHTTNASLVFGEGPNRWCVYAYIFPKHPHFKNFSGPHMFQDAAAMLPLHGGPSYLEYPMYEGAVSSVKVGSDYHHLHDERFSHYATPQDAYSVFEDAQELHAWLASLAERGEEQPA